MVVIDITPIIDYFTADRNLIVPGESVRLAWATRNTISCTLNGSSVSTSGSVLRSPLTTTTYTLIARSSTQSVSRSITIIVSAPVPPPPTPPPPTPPPPPPVICVPGALKCIGPDLYICNSTGTAWDLKQRNAPSCITSGTIPDFWTDPVGWVIGTITQAWESMLGFVSGQFNIFLNNLKTWQAGFAAQLAVFIKDPLKSLRTWLDNVYTTVSAVAGQITSGITSWYNANLKPTVDSITKAVFDFRDWIGSGYDSLASWWSSKISGITTWINNAAAAVTAWTRDQIAILQRGWDNVTAGISAWVSDQIAVLQRGWDSIVAGLRVWWDNQIKLLTAGWNNIIAGVTTWIQDQLGILQRGWDSTFAQIPGVIETYITGVKSWVFDVVPGIAESVIIGLIESIPGLKTVIDFIGSLFDLVTGKYPRHENIQDFQDEQQTHQQKIKELISRLK